MLEENGIESGGLERQAQGVVDLERDAVGKAAARGEISRRFYETGAESTPTTAQS